MQRTKNNWRQPTRECTTLSAIAFAALAMWGGPAFGQYWKTSVTTGNWSNGNNWSATSPNGTDNAGPPSGTAAEIFQEDAVNRLVSLDVSASLSGLEIENGGGGVNTLSQTSQVNLFVTGEEYVNVGGVQTQSAGADTIEQGLYVGASGHGGSTATGTYNLSGGSITVGGTPEYQGITVGYGTPGVFNQSGGAVAIVGAYEMIGVGAGTYNQTGGSQVIGSASSPELLQIGNIAQSTGAFFLSGTGNTLLYGTAYVGGSSDGPPGSGTLAISGGTMTITGGLIVAPTGTLSQSGGMVSAGSININSGASFQLTGGTLSIGAGTFANASAVSVGNGSAATTLNLTGGSSGTYSFSSGLTIAAGATLTGGGTITNSATSSPVNIFGTIAPLASQSSILVRGSFTLKSSATTLIRRIGATPAFGSITSTGNLALAGVLAVYEDAQNEAMTTSSQSFIILQATGTASLSGTFSNIASGQTLITTDDTASFLVTVNQGVDGDVVLSDFQAVPEPAAAGIVAFSAGAALLRRRRARQA